MKKIFAFLVVVLLTISVFAQAPQKMSYQSVIRKSNNELLANTKIGMKISIIQDSIDGKVVYSETLTPITNSNGLVSIEFGGQTGFSDIIWQDGPYFLKTETDPTGGTTYTITGTNQLLSVPYALAAGTLLISKKGRAYDTYLKDDGSYSGIPRIEVEYPFDSVPTVTDIDGNTYSTVKIGNQVWMAENLRVTRFNDNTSIPKVLDWWYLETPAYCYYNNTSNTDTINTYGALYSWYTVETEKLCPVGWHVPSDEEWTELTDYLGGLAGGRIKESGTVHWRTPNTDAIGDSKFSALPGGYRSSGGFLDIGREGNWWCATEAYDRYIVHDRTYFTRTNFAAGGKGYGMSVRCVRD